MGLDKTIISLVMNSIKGIAKFDISIDSMISQFNKGCPTKDRLLLFIQNKNKISTALTQTQSQLNLLNNTKITLENSVNIFTTIITTIKLLPAPVATLPISALTNLSDILDNVGDKLKQGRNILKIVPNVIKDLNKNISDINSKLDKLNNLILKCLNQETQNMNPNDRETYYREIGLEINNQNSNSGLEQQLKPTSNNPYNYNGFLLTIEYDPTNKFTFPRRRIRAIKDKVILYGDYSYSSSTDILVDEMKFRIDNL